MNDQQKPILHNPSPFPGKAPKIPGPLTPDAVRYIARDEARKEIVATSTALANKVQEVMARSMNPINDRLSVMRGEQHGTGVSLNAIAELLVEKGIFTREEIEAKVEDVHKREIAKQKEISQRKADIATGKGSVLAPTAPEEAPAEEAAPEGETPQ